MLTHEILKYMDIMTIFCAILHQGPRNLYGRDSKFRPTFKNGAEKHVFSVPLSMTWCPQNAPNCTDLHLYFQKNFPELTPRTPKTGKPLPDSSPQRPPTIPLFHSFQGRCLLHYTMIIH